jgi:histidine decarboxylase
MDKQSRKKLDKKYHELMRLENTFIGYPVDAKFDYSPLYRFLSMPLNNVGDPFEKSTYRLQTKEFEREALGFFAKLFHLKSYWGYVTNGGTEGNLYGLYAGREMLPEARVFHSDHAHYSIRKNIHILRMQGQPVAVRDHGEMDYHDLEKKLKGVKSAIVLANIGSTMTGAIDNIPVITEILEKLGVKYYIHADAALYGMVLPFVSDVKFDFRTKVSSLAISGHKFIGSPIPCGVALIRKPLAKALHSYIEYIDAHDTTLSGSRDAFTPLIIWYRLKTLGLRGFKKHAEYSVSLADFLANSLRQIGWPDVHQSYLTVSFKRPSKKLVSKWELAVNDKLAHVVCMPHETKEELARFVKDMQREV